MNDNKKNSEGCYIPLEHGNILPDRYILIKHIPEQYFRSTYYGDTKISLNADILIPTPPDPLPINPPPNNDIFRECINSAYKKNKIIILTANFKYGEFKKKPNKLTAFEYLYSQEFNKDACIRIAAHFKDKDKTMYFKYWRAAWFDAHRKRDHSALSMIVNIADQTRESADLKNAFEACEKMIEDAECKQSAYADLVKMRANKIYFAYAKISNNPTAWRRNAELCKILALVLVKKEGNSKYKSKDYMDYAIKSAKIYDDMKDNIDSLNLYMQMKLLQNKLDRQVRSDSTRSSLTGGFFKTLRKPDQENNPIELVKLTS